LDCAGKVKTVREQIQEETEICLLYNKVDHICVSVISSEVCPSLSSFSVRTDFLKDSVWCLPKREMSFEYVYSEM
jgi:hypothetical protein